jgi:2-polyprenyl-3-methyl-5-hydroxy-6-metoxy-1,4-benzoquinol methylase
MGCIICSTNNFIYQYNSTLKKCAQCGFVTANVNIHPDELKKIYTVNYFKGEEYLDYEKEKIALQFNFQKRLKQIANVLPEKKFNKTLEIGCAYGYFGETLRSKYPESSYTGIDIVQESIEFGKNKLHLNLVETDYLSFYTPEKYTNVFMWDVIEHLEKPDHFLKKIHSELNTFGIVFLTTGDIGAMLPKLQKNRWRMIHPPSHLHYFSKKTITLLLEKEGFKVVFIKYPSVYRSIKQIFYSMFILKKKKHSFITKIFNLIPEKWLIPINTYDIMFVCAQKR